MVEKDFIKLQGAYYRISLISVVKPQEDGSAYVYFSAPVGGSFRDPVHAVKVGGGRTPGMGQAEREGLA